MAGEINFEQLMTAIMSLMLATYGLGSALSDLGDQRSGLEAAQRIFQACVLIWNSLSYY